MISPIHLSSDEASRISSMKTTNLLSLTLGRKAGLQGPPITRWRQQMTTTISELIVKLQHAEGPDRQLDTEISIILGYERRKVIVDVKGGTERRKLWFKPGKEGPVRIPRYTASIDVARHLTNELVLDCAAGFSWSGSYATARINDGPPFIGRTAAIALCVAALSAVHSQKMGSI